MKKLTTTNWEQLANTKNMVMRCQDCTAVTVSAVIRLDPAEQTKKLNRDKVAKTILAMSEVCPSTQKAKKELETKIRSGKTMLSIKGCSDRENRICSSRQLWLPPERERHASTHWR